MKDIAIISGLSAFILILMQKWGIIEWLQVHGWEYISRAANCDFCLSWWVSLVVALAYAETVDDWLLLWLVFPSTIICRFFITH